MSYLAPGEEIRFGDIFEAEHFVALHARRDSREMGELKVPPKFTRGLAKAAKVEHSGEVTIYAPELPRIKTPWALARGDKTRAVLLTDNCTIANLYGYGHREYPQQKGELLFAKLEEPGAKAVEKERTNPNFRKFALPPGPFMKAGALVDLRWLFTVDKRDVVPDERIASLDEDLVERLAIRWAGRAVRRGPEVVSHHAAEVEKLLTREGATAPVPHQIATVVAEALAHAWRLEGRSLVDAADASRDNTPAEQSLLNLVADLEHLRDSAHAAVAGLRKQLGLEPAHDLLPINSPRGA